MRGDNDRDVNGEGRAGAKASVKVSVMELMYARWARERKYFMLTGVLLYFSYVV